MIIKEHGADVQKDNVLAHVKWLQDHPQRHFYIIQSLSPQTTMKMMSQLILFHFQESLHVVQ